MSSCLQQTAAGQRSVAHHLDHCRHRPGRRPRDGGVAGAAHQLRRVRADELGAAQLTVDVALGRRRARTPRRRSPAAWRW